MSRGKRVLERFQGVFGFFYFGNSLPYPTTVIQISGGFHDNSKNRFGLLIKLL